ncbi:hypothetical protein [Mesorhizobium sp. M1406]|uniref:hypothetical protein n=1 Tax=Mesorhizobium sp. M1406 TaxID=2957099 RepID=UPI00333DF0D6
MGGVISSALPSLPYCIAPRSGTWTVARLRKALQMIAQLVIEDVSYLPIFERLEREVALAEMQAGTLDPVEKARAIARAVRH